MDDNSHAAQILRNLQRCTVTNTPRFSLVGKYKCKVLEVIDGDTFRGALEFGGQYYVVTFRILGINAPELHPRLSLADRLNVIRKAKAAKVRLAELLGAEMDMICDVEVEAMDAFGRALAHVTCCGSSVGDQLLNGGFARQFFTKHSTRKIKSTQ